VLGGGSCCMTRHMLLSTECKQVARHAKHTLVHAHLPLHTPGCGRRAPQPPSRLWRGRWSRSHPTAPWRMWRTW
jgi:hypothetical protein